MGRWAAQACDFLPPTIGSRVYLPSPSWLGAYIYTRTMSLRSALLRLSSDSDQTADIAARQFSAISDVTIYSANSFAISPAITIGEPMTLIGPS
jgi:hypothetical protein